MKKLLLMCVTLALVAFTGYEAMAQAVTGRVISSESPEGVPGVNVLIKGTSTGVVTDFDGNYSINAGQGNVLVFSFIGFVTQEIAVGSQTVIDVNLEPDVAQLAEVIVTGYTTQRAKEITAAVSSVNMEQAVRIPMDNAAEALQGRASGVTVINEGQPGAPPTVRIRGYGTPNNNDPLYIIDGVQTTNPSVLNSINPMDIEQMNVLKDGAAAIYGSRASNGVIIVTTKKGKFNQAGPVLSFDTYFGSQSATNLPELLSAQQHADMIWASQSNDGNTPGHPQYGNGASPVIPSSLQLVPEPTTVNPNGTDWLDEIFQTARIQNYALSLSDGSENGRYLMSVNYLEREGIQLATGFERLSTRLNTEFNVSERVTFGQHMNISFSNQNANSRVEDALRSSPLIPAYDDNGEFAGTYLPAAGLGNTRSPVAQLLRGKDNYNKSLRVVGDIYAEFEIIEGLTYKSSFGMNYETFNNRSFQPLDPEHSEPISTNTLNEGHFDAYEWVWSNTLVYNKRVEDHSINAILGVEAVYNNIRGYDLSRTGYLFEDPDFYLLNNGSGNPIVQNAYDATYTLFSLFANANYAYRDKYLFGFNVRQDETSRFSSNNNAAVFPSFNAGWIISEEAFWTTSAISNLKIKASWGQMGNQSLPAANPDVNVSTLSESLSYYALDGSTASVGALLESIGNPDLTWETSNSINVGLEMGFVDNKLGFAFDFYTITTEDLITQDNSLISTTAIDAAAPYVNIGSVKNTGVDISINYADQSTSGFGYGIDFIFSTYKNEVTELITDFFPGDGGFRGGAVTRTEVGQPISSFYGRIVEGVDGSGRFVYKDVNGDGSINDDDRDYIGSPHPDFTWGLNLRFDYKGFDVIAFVNGSQGNDIYNYEKIYTDFPTFFNGNRSVRVLPGGEGRSAVQPGLSETITNSETQANSFFVEDGSFVKLKNLQLGYTFPQDLSKKAAMSLARIYLQGTNLITSTKYNGFDPEIGPQNGDNLTIGVDNGRYPQSQVFTVGLNLKF